MSPDIGAVVNEVLKRQPAGDDRGAGPPYLIGITGSVAVGKSTFARALGQGLSEQAGSPRVDIVSTDGFLFTNRVLAERDLRKRKGFPESYDVPSLRNALAAIKRRERVEVPRYSHVTYDVDPTDVQIVSAPDYVLLDGLHLGQIEVPGTPRQIDTLIYLDADEALIEKWFTERLLPLMAAGVDDPASFYHAYRDLDPAGRNAFAARVWRDINLPNLRNHIQADRALADLVVCKAADHSVTNVTGTKPFSPRA